VTGEFSDVIDGEFAFSAEDFGAEFAILQDSSEVGSRHVMGLDEGAEDVER